jgi:pyruvate formate lyase activating enzyme
MMYPERCTDCGRCSAVCPTGAAKNSQTIREKCVGCGKCVEACLQTARTLMGRRVTSEEAVKELVKDKILFEQSGGGITLGGGDVVAQPKFAAEILKTCQEQGIHTVIDTSGYCKWDAFSEIIKHVDLAYFDIKCILPEKHVELTGVKNDLILKNLEKMDELGMKFSIRMPIIPTYNDAEEIIEATGEYLRRLQSDFVVYLLAFHSYGASKYEKLNLGYKLGNLSNLDKKDLLPLKKILEKYGLKVQVQ